MKYQTTMVTDHSVHGCHNPSFPSELIKYLYLSLIHPPNSILSRALWIHYRGVKSNCVKILLKYWSFLIMFAVMLHLVKQVQLNIVEANCFGWCVFDVMHASFFSTFRVFTPLSPPATNIPSDTFASVWTKKAVVDSSQFSKPLYFNLTPRANGQINNTKQSYSLSTPAKGNKHFTKNNTLSVFLTSFFFVPSHEVSKLLPQSWPTTWLSTGILLWLNIVFLH